MHYSFVPQVWLEFSVGDSKLSMAALHTHGEQTAPLSWNH